MDMHTHIDMAQGPTGIAFPVMGAYQALAGVLLLMLWVFVRYRLKKNSTPTLDSINYLQKYFLFFAAFSLALSAPYVLVYVAPRFFPLTMAWAYVVGHVFAILSLSYLSRMTLNIVPRLARFDLMAATGWLVANALYAVLNTVYVVVETQPMFDAADGMAHFEVPFYFGIALLVMSVLAYGPAIILFALSAFRGRGATRIRTLFLSSGMLLAMLFTHTHAVAHHQQPSALGEFLNAIGLVLIALGVTYNAKQHLGAEKTVKVGK